MKTYHNLFQGLCSYENLQLAFQKARKRKTKKEYVIRFEKNLVNELYALQWELLAGIYRPGPLKAFTVRDPKTRKISASHFRDRVVHHAICNVIEPIFEPRFIYDTFANRKGKGTSGTLKRADHFIRKVGNGYALKADIRHYFDTVDHEVLLSILGRRIKDQQLMELVRVILTNHTSKPRRLVHLDNQGASESESPLLYDNITPEKTENHITLLQKKGMPLGNLTSQFFANIYLAELDHYVKHELRVRYYLRYVDDFIIFSKDKKQLQAWEDEIATYLHNRLKLQLHPDKTKIMPIKAGVQLVGFRVFRHHKLLKKSNLRRLHARLARYKEMVQAGELSREAIQTRMAGWEGYARMGNTYGLRAQISAELGVPG